MTPVVLEGGEDEHRFSTQSCNGVMGGGGSIGGGGAIGGGDAIGSGAINAPVRCRGNMTASDTKSEHSMTKITAHTLRWYFLT